MDDAPLDLSLIQQVLEQSVQLLGFDDSARAEAWASGVLGLWREPGALVDAPAADRQLLEALTAERSDEALALACALTSVLPVAARDAARDAVTMLREDGVSSPTWAAAVGTTRPGDAWVIADPPTGRRTAILEFVSSDGSHTMLAELQDQMLENDVLVDVSFGPAAEDLFLALAEPGADPLEHHPADPTELAADVTTGWRQASAEGVQPSESWVMNRSLALSRLQLFEPLGTLESVGWAEAVRPEEPQVARPEDLEANAASRAVLAAALGDFDASDTDEIGAAASHLRNRIETGGWPGAAIAAGGNLGPDLTDLDFVLAAAGSYACGRQLPMPADEAEAVGALEWADWLGAVIEMVRGGSGRPVTPGGLVDNVNRCPEVSTTIPKRDREYFEKAFGLVIEAWSFCGFIDEGQRLTDLGLVAIPLGLDRAWRERPGGVA